MRGEIDDNSKYSTRNLSNDICRSSVSINTQKLPWWIVVVEFKFVTDNIAISQCLRICRGCWVSVFGCWMYWLSVVSVGSSLLLVFGCRFRVLTVDCRVSGRMFVVDSLRQLWLPFFHCWCPPLDIVFWLCYKICVWRGQLLTVRDARTIAGAHLWT